MESVEKIPVFIYIKDGKTICICHAGRKGCGRYCTRDKVTRDKFSGLKEGFRQNKYGK